MKRVAIVTLVFTMLAVPALIASSGGGMSTPSPMPMQQKSPHEQAVDFYNNAERRIDGLAKLHDEMKTAAATDPQKATKLQGKLTKGLENAAADFWDWMKTIPGTVSGWASQLRAFIEELSPKKAYDYIKDKISELRGWASDLISKAKGWLGRMLIAAPSDPDGGWPSTAVRRLLERLQGG